MIRDVVNSRALLADGGLMVADPRLGRARFRRVTVPASPAPVSAELPLAWRLPEALRAAAGLADRAVDLRAHPLLLMGVVLAVASTWAALHMGAWGLDDAYISYRYAQNLVAGHGLVFNPGESVEGYSNLLYVLLLAPGLALLGPDGAHGWSLALGIACTVGALRGVEAAAAETLWRPRSLVVAGVFASSPTVWFAAGSGLETPLVLLLFASSWLALVRLESGVEAGRVPRPAWWLALCLAATVLTRADGFVMAGLFLAHLGLWTLHRRRWRALCLCSAAAVGTALLQLAWRLHYYGELLPNTYYAKVSGTLSERVGFAVQSIFPQLHAIHPFLLVILVAALALPVAALWRGRRDGLVTWAVPPFEIFFGLSWLGYWLYVGGDVFGDRFLLPLIPLGAALLVRHGLAPLQGMSLPGRAAALALVAAFLLLPWRGAPFFAERTHYDPWIALGRFLGERHPGSLLAVDAAGKIPFFSGLETIDVYGLNDATIARREMRFVAPGHSKTDPFYVLSREPDLIAGWVIPRDFGINPGLPRYRYQASGYELRYLLFDVEATNLAPPRGEPAIREVTRLDQRELLRLWRDGYRYGVVVRADAS